MVAVYGRLEASRSALASGTPNKFKMIQPQFEVLADPGKAPDAEFAMLEMGRIVPVYESLGGTTPWGAKLTSKWTRRVMWDVFEELSESAGQQASESARETVPAAMLARLVFPSRLGGREAGHFPEARSP